MNFERGREKLYLELNNVLKKINAIKNNAVYMLNE
jgi:hypothetical protein